MNSLYLRAKSDKYTLAYQENAIKEYMHVKGLEVDSVYVDFAPINQKLDEREELKNFIHTLQEGDRLYIYDLRVFSPKVGEIIQILNCVFEHEIDLIVTKYDIIVSKEMKAEKIITLLYSQRQENRQKLIKLGRPKGSISRSKYDKYREEILEMLKEGKSVSEIAKKLGASRSSIRDYIASRDLESIAKGLPKEAKGIPTISCQINS